MKLLQELFANGLISESKMDELQKEVEKTGKREDDIILENKILSENDLFDLKSRTLRVPLQKIKAEEVPVDVLEIVPDEAANNYKMVAFAKKDNVVQVGMVYPENLAAQNALRFLASQQRFSYHVFLITPTNFLEMQKQRKNLAAETKRTLEELAQERKKRQGINLIGQETPDEEQSTISEDAPVIKMVFVILRHALEAKASDIHIEPRRDKLDVRFRLNGVLKSSLTLPLKVHLSVVARIKIMSGLKIDESRVPQDGRFSTKIDGANIDFRVATFPTLFGEKVELRILDPSTGSRTFDDLGLSGRNLEVIKDAIKKPYGLILFTGPTGSGKTTTQYAILRILNDEKVNIVTIEDPIEYSIDGINQSQIKPDIGYTFASGLRQILRQDPNIIMVGEIRDEETADLVMNAALTGHIVLSTLHTNSSIGVVARLIDMKVRPFLIPSTLRVVIAQRLVRTLCPHCKIKIKPEEKIAKFITEKVDNMPLSEREKIKIPDPFYIYATKGCEECSFTGYSDRTALFEVLSINDEISELILKDPSELAIFKAAQKQGMITMEQDGILKVLEGETSIDEIVRVTTER
jgi:type IV pilus assembly protein PilB